MSECIEQLSDGGPAFPRVSGGSIAPSSHHGHSDVSFKTVQGMTLRDYFAALALTAIPTIYRSYNIQNGVMTDASVAIIALNAYRLADAMLKAREAK